MKKIGIGLLVVLVLLVAAVLIAPSFVDWNAYKDRIAAEVHAATGRELAIDGNISLALLPAPALSVEIVRLANAAGGSEPTMVA
ncbi:MAG TPA: AsmA family protein, partial [Kiloniellales bacterium]